MDSAIVTLDRQGSLGAVTGDYITTFGLTSAAAPQVSGIAALMLSINPNLTANDIETIIQNTAEKVGDYDYNWNSLYPGHSRELGYGRVNAYKAVKTDLAPIIWTIS